MNKKVLVIIQARLGSTRLPNKAFKKIGKRTIIEMITNRISKSKNIDNLIVATTNKNVDKKLHNFLKKKNIKVFLGSEKNVLDRFYKAAKLFSPKYIVRICGDCPFVDFKLLDEMVKLIKVKNYDYVSNVNPPTYPDGLDIEIFSFKALKRAHKKAKNNYDKEHVTPYIVRNIKNSYNFETKKNYSNIRLTVDEPIDLNVLNKTYKNIKNKNNFSYRDIVKLIENKSNLFSENKDIIRNYGTTMSTDQKLWKRAKRSIPGGNMLLSKRPEMFLPGLWPAYFSKSKGCHVWDLDGKKYVDLSTMSVGTNILGYSNKKIDNEVIKVVKKGNMSSLNCPEEVYLSEKLLEMHKGFDMIRFAKTGGEANSVAIRIARAYTGKDNIAICGYHGWHDWYLSANLSSKKNLTNHLLPGLSAIGVPKKLINTVFPFEYNDINKFYKICKTKKISIVKMEVSRNVAPKNNFLKKVQKFCKKNKILLIFDECTSGFRETFGGLHLKYKVTPDICILGKALGNGYPITAVMGRKDIMDSAQSTFISSTFWTERTGYVAALKTLGEMEKNMSWKIISTKGKIIKKKWLKLAKKHKLKIAIGGLDALPNFSIKSKKWTLYKSYITYIMLKNSILAYNSIYLSTAHNESVLKKYFKVLDFIFKKIKDFESGKDINILNKVPVCHTGFKRLN